MYKGLEGILFSYLAVKFFHWDSLEAAQKVSMDFGLTPRTYPRACTLLGIIGHLNAKTDFIQDKSLIFNTYF
ncbi:hypothetical protein AMR41_26070 [Hapalosiphon sp. MRB220]|nr:hypothetical protein AMR41_26070 [Hapalosiphon sp. MRB220]